MGILFMITNHFILIQRIENSILSITIEELIERYGEDRIINTIAIDKLSWEEIKDLDYLEDRIVTHLEWEG